MPTAANTFALDLNNDVYFNRISNVPVKAAVSTIAMQLTTYRFQATAAAAVATAWS